MRAATLAVAVGVVGLLGVTGTAAFWTDRATMQPTTITSGTLDITLGGQLVGLANNGGTWTN